jgi:hypothetical protein
MNRTLLLTLTIVATPTLACSSNGTNVDGRGGNGTGGASQAAAGAGGGTDAASTATAGGNVGSGGASKTGGNVGSGGATGTVSSAGGMLATGGANADGTGGAVGSGGVVALGGRTASASGGNSAGGNGAGGSSSATGGTSAVGSGTCTGPVATFSGPLSTGIVFMDDQGKRVNAHGGGIIKEGDTYYLHGEYFLSTTTDNNFNGFSMYSSKDMATWKWEKMVLPQQPSGLLGPNRKGERPHIIKCPATGEFVLYAHAADVTYQADKEVVYATSSTVNGDYTLQGALTNASGTTAAHSDMSALTDGAKAYVITESAHVYTLASDCHSWLTDVTYSVVNGSSGGGESPTLFKAGSTYYWIMSNKTGWRANNNFYSTAPAITGPWTYRGYVAPVTDPADVLSDQRTWLSQVTWVQPVQGCSGTVYVFWGDHWDGTQDTTAPGKHNDRTGYVFQPLVFTGTAIGLPTYHDPWKLDVGAGTWSD